MIRPTRERVSVVLMTGAFWIWLTAAVYAITDQGQVSILVYTAAMILLIMSVVYVNKVWRGG